MSMCSNIHRLKGNKYAQQIIVLHPFTPLSPSFLLSSLLLSFSSLLLSSWFKGALRFYSPSSRPPETMRGSFSAAPERVPGLHFNPCSSRRTRQIPPVLPSEEIKPLHPLKSSHNPTEPQTPLITCGTLSEPQRSLEYLRGTQKDPRSTIQTDLRTSKVQLNIFNNLIEPPR